MIYNNITYLDLPLPGGGGGASVNINVDNVALVRGWYKHVLTSVVATDDGRSGATWVGDSEGVSATISGSGSISSSHRG